MPTVVAGKYGVTRTDEGLLGIINHFKPLKTNKYEIIIIITILNENDKR